MHEEQRMKKQQVRIDQVPANRVALIKALRLVGHTGLKQAGDLAGHLDRFRHSVLVAGIDAAVAEHIARVLEDAGAKVTVEDSAVSTPMLCCPTVNAKYRWGALRLVKKAI